MRTSGPFRAAASACAIIVSLLAAGCGDNSSSLTSTANSASITGNWKIAAATTPATGNQVAAVAGSLATSNGVVTGTFHTAALTGQTASQLCIAPSTSLNLTGKIAADNSVTLASASTNGSIVTVKGNYNATTKTLSNATLAVAGTCTTTLTPSIAAQYLPITGTYTGNFNSNDNYTLPVSATLTQTSSPDANGTFHLTGSATFAQNPCISSPVVTDSVVTGDAFSATYTDSATHVQVVATGTFNTDATKLTITGYTMSGSATCSDTGSGLLTKQ